MAGTETNEVAATTPDVADMTERELLEEIVRTNRAVAAALAEFQRMGPGGIMKMLMGRG